MMLSPRVRITVGVDARRPEALIVGQCNGVPALDEAVDRIDLAK